VRECDWMRKADVYYPRNPLSMNKPPPVIQGLTTGRRLDPIPRQPARQRGGRAQSKLENGAAQTLISTGGSTGSP